MAELIQMRADVVPGPIKCELDPPMDMPFDDDISKIVSEIVVNFEDFYSSATLKKLLRQVMKSAILEPLARLWTLPQNVKTRLDVLLKLAVSMLYIPPPSLLTLEGVPSIMSSSNGSFENDTAKYMLSRMEHIRLLIVRMFTFILHCEHVLHENGTDVSCDNERVNLLLTLICMRRPGFPSISAVVTEYAPVGLECMACHILDVRCLSHEVNRAVSAVLSQLTQLANNTNTNTNTNISSNNKTAAVGQGNRRSVDAMLLRPPVVDFICWLRDNASALSKLCLHHELIHAVDSSLREQLRGENYSSPTQLMDTYRNKYQTHLKAMVMPIPHFKPQDMEQSIKEVRRETILLVEGLEEGRGGDASTTPVSGENLVEALRALVRKALRRLQPKPDTTRATTNATTSSVMGVDVGDATDARRRRRRRADSEPVLRPKATSSTTSNKAPSDSEDDGGRRVSEPVESLLHGHLVEQLVRYALLACSRTISAGDALFVTEDLYAGEGLVLCPVRSEDPNSRTKVILTPTGIRVTLRGTYCLYLKPSLDELSNRNCSNSPSSTQSQSQSQLQPQPLIGIHTCTRTFLLLRPSEDNDLQQSTMKESVSKLFRLLFLCPEKVCLRTLSIEPFEVQT